MNHESGERIRVNAPIYTANCGLANRLNVVMEMLCAGDGGVLHWAINDQCSLDPEAIFSAGLIQRLRIGKVPYWAKGPELFYLSPGWPVEKVRGAALDLMENFLPGFDPPVYRYAVHGRWNGFVPPHPENHFMGIVRDRLVAGCPVFLLTDAYRERMSAALGGRRVVHQSSPSLAHDRDRACLKDQILFCRDLKTLWMAENAITNSAETTMVDMRAFLGKPTARPVLPRDSHLNWASRSGLQNSFLQMTTEQRFTTIYQKKQWACGGVLSGHGSMAENTGSLAMWLEGHADQGMRNLLDLGCGDLNWISGCEAIECGVIDYEGWDVVEPLIAHHRRVFPWFRGRAVDLEAAPRIPSADIVLLKDVIFHLCNGAVEQILKFVDQAEWKRLLVTTHPGTNNRLRRAVRGAAMAPYDVEASGLIRGKPATYLPRPGGVYAIYER